MMSHIRTRRALAVLLVLCVLVLGSLASAQSIAHESHHAHHQKATHSNVLCSWMCAAGQGWQGTVVPTPLELTPAESIELALPARTTALHAENPAPRGPPIR